MSSDSRPLSCAQTGSTRRSWRGSDPPAPQAAGQPIASAWTWPCTKNKGGFSNKEDHLGVALVVFSKRQKCCSQMLRLTGGVAGLVGRGGQRIEVRSGPEFCGPAVAFPAGPDQHRREQRAEQKTASSHQPQSARKHDSSRGTSGRTECREAYHSWVTVSHPKLTFTAWAR